MIVKSAFGEFLGPTLRKLYKDWLSQENNNEERIMKTTLIEINRTVKGQYIIGFGIGYDKDSHYGYFVGVIIQFFWWIIRIGVSRERE